MKIITFSILLLLFLSCKTSKNLTQDNSTSNNDSMITATLGEIPVSSDAIEILAVRMKGNIMLLDVQYSGGCADHSFQLIGSPMIAKSLPPIRAIQLVHNANADHCRELISKTLEVDITALAYVQESGSKIILTLEGWKERIEYSYE